MGSRKGGNGAGLGGGNDFDGSSGLGGGFGGGSDGVAGGVDLMMAEKEVVG